MPSYRCKIAVSENKTIDKIILSSSLASLKKKVKKDGGFLIEAEKELDQADFRSFIRNKKLRPKDFYSFNQEFLTLLRAGVPIVIAFDGIIEKGEKNYLNSILKRIQDDISEGESISNAFEKYVNIFSPLYIATLRSGEVSGDIPGAIEEYLEYFKRSQKIKQKIRAASVYPVILTLCSFLVVAFLIIFVVPAITGTFVEAGAELPFFTQILLSISGFVKTYFIFLLVVLGFLFWGVRYYLKTEKGKLKFDTYYLKLPFLGEITRYYSTALFSSSLSTVLASGLPLNQALKISKALVTNAFMQVGIKNAITSIEKGDGVANAFEAVNVFPAMAIRMMSAGEEGGSLVKVLKDLAIYYENDLEDKLTILTSAIEPVLMVLMGFIIGFIMLAMYMPIFQMAGTLG